MKKANCPKKDSYKKKLSDCVFCGRDEPFCRDHIGIDNAGVKFHQYHVECDRCLARGPRSMVREKAINAWNKRAKVKQS